jgi:tetratricopeptide (TPR) repeat protein
MRETLKRVVFLAVAITFLATGLEARADDKFAKMMLKKADKLFKGRGDKAKTKEALKKYEKALALAPDSTEVRWKLAQCLYYLGKQTSNKDEKKKLYESGIRYAQEAVSKDEKCVPCHFWLGVTYGKFGEAKGILQSLGLVPHIQKAMNTVIKLNEKFAYGGAHRVLGRVYNRLPAMKGGDNEKSVMHLKKAVEIGPSDLMNHRFYAEVLLSLGKKDEAKKELQFVIDFPKEKFLKDRKPESKEEQEIAAKLMKESF